jgi:peptidoglycan/xylan/chitin deacetylase (PgdA/CDA1 family)
MIVLSHNPPVDFRDAKPISVPVLTYHSVADRSDAWPFRHLSCPVATFESHLTALRTFKYHTISLHSLYAYMSEGKKLPSRSVVLTFDDGYLDNWVYAYPLLKKYGMHGTIFVNPDFVDPAKSTRPNLEDVWSRHASLSDLPTCGFLSWQEMRVMERSGNIDIQSHGLTHTWYFSSSEIADFHHPGDRYPWLAWNAHPERKYLWMTENQQTLVPWGTPIYEHNKSLATRRYFPDHDLDTALVHYVNSRNGATFFETVDWRQRLKEVVTDYRATKGHRGRFESDEEYKQRLHHELAGSKQMIEAHLQHKVDFLCWPGGGYNDTAVEISKELGYLASTLVSGYHRTTTNRFGEDPSRWTRISAPVFSGRGTLKYKKGLYLICVLNSARGSHLFNAIRKALKAPFKCSEWWATLVKPTVGRGE